MLQLFETWKQEGVFGSRMLHLFETWKQEGVQAGGAGVHRQAGDVLEEAGAQLPLPVVQEGDGRRQQEVVALPAGSRVEGASATGVKLKCLRPKT